MKIDIPVLQRLAEQVTTWSEGLEKSFVARCTEEIKACGLEGDVGKKVTALAESNEELQQSMIKEVREVVTNIINFVADANGFSTNAEELFAAAAKKASDAAAPKVVPQRGRNFSV